MKTIFTNEDIDYMKNHYLDMSYKAIGDVLGFSERQIRGKINNLGLSKLRHINSRYFQYIDNSLKAYLFGFIYADGWVIYNPTTRTYELGLELRSEDRYILEELNYQLGNMNIIKHVNPKKKIIKGNETVSGHQDLLRIFSKDLVVDLMNHGILPNKSYRESIPKIQDKFFFDFLCGYIDGNGCYYFNKNNKLNIHITSGTKSILEYIQNHLNQYNFITHIYQSELHKYRLYCCDQDSVKQLLSKLYNRESKLCLIRKKHIVESFLGSTI